MQPHENEILADIVDFLPFLRISEGKELWKHVVSCTHPNRLIRFLKKKMEEQKEIVQEAQNVHNLLRVEVEDEQQSPGNGSTHGICGVFELFSMKIKLESTQNRI